jgi:hypothetical protein
MVSVVDDTFVDQPKGPATHAGEVGRLRARSKALGERLGEYLVVGHLGSGAMGDVYVAERGDERVALKLLSRTAPTLLYRFKREFRALVGVSHPNLISLRELVVLADGRAFFTMELIDGQPFTEYVRRQTVPGRLPNLVRLGRAFRQLADALVHLHAAGCVHRDLKPTNVMVTGEGRVVVLDFGLVSEMADEDHGLSRDGQVLGTPAYMAPEQTGLGMAGPPTDFYALGVMLFECLTGQLPFRGSAMDILLQKQDASKLPDPGTLVPNVPPGLRELCLGLLSPQPETRPSGHDIIGVLARDLGGEDEAPPRRGPSVRAEAPFIGREHELRMLDDALTRVRETASAVTVYVSGGSGHGKTALIQRFLAVQREHGVLSLRGRCLERESVPYKGVDSIVDALSVHLRRRSDIDLAGLRPRHVAPLVQIFPVLGDLWSMKSATARAFEPTEQRRLGIAALREIITRIADERPLVIHIDDFQWADVDGANLIASLVRPPDPPALLLIVSFRAPLPGDPKRPALETLVAADTRNGRDIRNIQLAPLSEADAAELAMRLMSASPSSQLEPSSMRRRANMLARSSQGVPFYLGQIILGGLAGEGGEEGEELGDQDRIVTRRIGALARTEFNLLAIVAIAGGPASNELIERVYETISIAGTDSWIDGDSLPELIDRLCRGGLLTRREELDTYESEVEGTPTSSLVDVAHGRIREITLGELQAEELAELHFEFAHALEDAQGKPEALAEHFELAGEYARAAEYTERAAKQAVDALAFGRAVELYRRTLELLTKLETDDQLRTYARDSRRQRLRIALADQLVNFGRSTEAGRLYAELADEVDPSERLAYRRKAAEQLLHAGLVVEGIERTRDILVELGESRPRGRWRALLAFKLGRLRLRLRGGEFELRDEAKVDAKLLERIDTLMALNRGLQLHLEFHAYVLHNRLVQLALDTGEPRRLGMMLANEMAVVAAFGGDAQQVGQLAAQARELAAKVGDSQLDRAIDFQRDMVEFSLNRFREANNQLEALLPKLDDVPGADWLRFSSLLVYSSLCTITGRWRELHRNLPQWLAVADERGNLREIAQLQAYAALTELHRGQPERAREHIAAGRSSWDVVRYTYTTLLLDRADILLALFVGDIDVAAQQVERCSEAVARSSVSLNPVLQRLVEQLELRVRSLACLRAPADTKLRARVRKLARQLRKTGVSIYVGEAVIAEAMLASFEGSDASHVRRLWREAEKIFDDHGIECHLAALRHQLGKLTEGEESHTFAEQAAAYFAAHQIGEPERLADVLVPYRRG